MRGFQSHSSTECTNKPPSVGLKRSWGWKQDSTARNLASPTPATAAGCCICLGTSDRKAGASGKRPLHWLTGISSADSSQTCRSLPRTGIRPIPPPPELFDRFLHSSHPTEVCLWALGKSLTFLACASGQGTPFSHTEGRV